MSTSILVHTDSLTCAIMQYAPALQSSFRVIRVICMQVLLHAGFQPTSRVQSILHKLRAFMDQHVMSAEPEIEVLLASR